jgi:hypothetical protein
VTNLVVIPTRRDPGTAEQLRHAVRAWLTHLPDAEVVLIGGRPSWWAGDSILTDQRQGPGLQWSRNFPLALQAATELGIPSFWWAADDIFPLAPVPADPPTWCRPLDLDTYLSEWRKRRVLGTYTRMFVDGIDAQRKILRELGIQTQHNADMHMPHRVSAERLAELLDLFASRFPDHPAGHWRAVYGGLWPGRVVRMKDPKVEPGQRVNWSLGWVSTSNASWRRGVGREIGRTFTTPSRYEADK